MNDPVKPCGLGLKNSVCPSAHLSCNSSHSEDALLANSPKVRTSEITNKP